MKLDLSSLKKAIASLERVLATRDSALVRFPDDASLHEGLRAGVIQNF